jgi:hypothetical protein
MAATALKLIVSKDFLRLKAMLLIIYIALELYYRYFVTAHYEYMGFVLNANIFKYLITKIIFVVLLALSYTLYRRSLFLYSIYLLLLFFFLIPNSILFSLGDFPAPAFFSNVFFISVFLLSPYIKFSLPNLTLPVKYRAITLLLIALIFLAPIILAFGSDINLKTLFLSEVYSTRDLFSKNLTGVTAYLYHWEAKTVIPVALVFFMISRRFGFIGLFILILLYLYVISGNKIVYFTTMIVIFFYYIGKNYPSKTANFFFITIFLFALFPVLDYLFFAEPILMGTFVNRFLFIPALITNWYFDFFAGHPFYFAESHFFGMFVKSPYDMPVGFMLTDIYWNEPTVYANNGIVSDGFMNLGYIGVALFSVIFTLLFSLFNSLKIHRGFFGVFFGYIYLFLSVPFLSCFITGGIIVFIFLAVFLLNNNSSGQMIKAA